MTRVSLHVVLERPLHQAVEVKPGLCGRPQDVGGARVTVFLPRETEDFLGNQSEKERECVAVNKDERSWRSEEHSNVRHGDGEFGVCLLVLGLDKYLLTTLLPFRIVMHILCYCVLEVCDLLSDFGFTGCYS